MDKIRLNKIVKRDGRTEDFDPEKLINWAEWAEVVGANWNIILQDTLKRLNQISSSAELHEAMIQACLDKVMQGKTVLAIAHRLSTIAQMDRLLVLDKGKIVEQGTHAQLIAHDGIYAKLWAHQTGGFIGIE